MKRKYRNILFSVLIAAVVIIAAGLVIGIHSSSVAAYHERIAAGNQLLEEGDFSQAIIAYQEAVNEQPKKEDAYLKLATAYHMAGRDDYALETLRLALAVLPDSQKLKERQSQLEAGSDKDVVIALDDDYLDRLGSMSYADYGNTGSIETITPINDGGVRVRVKNLNADLLFRNTKEQPKAVSGGAPTADSLPAEVSLDNPMTLFGGGDGIAFADLEALGLDDLKVSNHQEYGSAVTFSKGLYVVEIESDEDGNIKAGAKNRVFIPAPSVRAGKNITLKGTVKNATNNEGIADVSMVFRKKGSGAPGPADVVSDGDGKYELKVDSGEYSVECSGDGIISETKSVFVPSLASEWTCDIVLSPNVTDGEARIVLNWGSYPSDLDSHLIGNGIHVSFLNPIAGSTAELDVDDTDGHGPETITIHDLKGKYTYVVDDYLRTGDLALSDAEVTVYLPGSEPKTFTIDGSGDGSNTWVVFELDNGVLNTIDEIRAFDL